MIRVAVCGAAGRMGQRILTLAAQKPEVFTPVGAVEKSGHPFIGKKLSEFLEVKGLSVAVTDSLKNAIVSADAVIDFTAPETSLINAQICADKKVPVVIGTTGISAEQHQILIQYSQNIPMVVAPNMSVGVNLLFALAAKVAAVLSDEYDVEIVEAHHRFKKDAPSGTAKRLAEVIAQARNVNLDKNAVYGRKGIVGERPRGEIGIHAVRMGNVVGDHTVSFASLVEQVELVHKAQSRDVFAEGALRAAQFVVTAKTGIFDMQDVLGLK